MYETSVFEKILKFVSIRPRSQKEILDWFKRKKVSQKDIDLVLKKLTDLGFLSDQEFAVWWVQQRSYFRPRSKNHLKFELFGKGISREIIESVLGGESFNEEESAKNLLTKKAKRFEKFDEEERSQKIAKFLISRGYSWAVARKLSKE